MTLLFVGNAFIVYMLKMVADHITKLGKFCQRDSNLLDNSKLCTNKIMDVVVTWIIMLCLDGDLR